MNAEYKKLDPRIELPAGEYYIGDPCYVLPDEEWLDALESTGYFGLYPDVSSISNTDRYAPKELQNGVFSRDGVLFAVSSTESGDGEYPVEWNGKIGSCGVDSGDISAIPMEIIDVDAVNADYPGGIKGLGVIHTFANPFTVQYVDGTIRFGPVHVLTGDDD
jgi:hypothetical protein